MREVVHRVDAPFVAGAVVFSIQDAVHHRVAHVQIGRRHIYFRAKHMCAIGELARFHTLQQVDVLFDRAIAVGASLAGLGKGATILPYLILAQTVHISLVLENKLLGKLV